MNRLGKGVETLIITGLLAAGCTPAARSALEGIKPQSAMAAASDASSVSAPAECIPLPNTSDGNNPAGFPLCDGTPISPDLTIATRYEGIGSSGLEVSPSDEQLGQYMAQRFQKENPKIFDGTPFATKWDWIENNGLRKPVLYVRGGETASFKGHKIEGKVAAVVTYNDKDQPEIFYFPFEELGHDFDKDKAILRVDADGQARVWGDDPLTGVSKSLAEMQKNEQGVSFWQIQK